MRAAEKMKVTPTAVTQYPKRLGKTRKEILPALKESEICKYKRPIRDPGIYK